MKPRIGVVIPAYNQPAAVMTALNSLLALQTTRTVGYLVQDDASPDVHLPGVVPPQIAPCFRNERNLGFAGNCNAGARAYLDPAGAPITDVLFFVNQDVYGVYGLSEGWDAALLAAFGSDPQIGVVGAQLRFPDGSIQNAGGTFDARCQPTHRCLGWKDAQHPAIAETRDVEWTTGAALAIRSSLFYALGGFDEAYQRGYFEDVDLCLRARASGWAVRYAPSVRLVHTVGTSGGSPYFAANARTFRARWVDTGRVKPALNTVRERFW